MTKYRILAALLFSICFGASAQRFQNSYNSIAEMLASPSLNSVSTNINVLGYRTPGDGGGGDFWYDKTSTALTNLGTVFQPTVLTSGRVFRQHDPMRIKARWFGAYGTLQNQGNNQGPDDTLALQDALRYTRTNLNTTLELGAGDFMLSDTLCVGPYTTVEGINPTARGDFNGDFSTVGLDDEWWTHNHSRTRLYPKIGFEGYMFYVGVTNGPVPGFPRGSITAWDGTRYTNFYYGTTLRNFQLEGYVNRLTRSHGIFLDRADAVTISGVAVSVIAGHGLRVEGTYETRIIDCAFEQFPNRSLPYLFMRMQDSQVHDSVFSGEPFWLESCGENGYIHNLHYNVSNFRYEYAWQLWNITSSVGETFTAATNRIDTGMPVIFKDSAPSGFNTNDTYWPYVISSTPTSTTFKLNSMLGSLGQTNGAGVSVGARNGNGIASGEVGSYVITTIPPGMIYNRNCINGYFANSRVDQCRQSAFVFSGPHSQMNTSSGDTLLNLGYDYLDLLDGLNHIDPFYAGYFLKDGAWGNSLFPAQVNGTISDRDPPFTRGNLTAFVIGDGCYLNNIGGGIWNAKTNYSISKVGTYGTRIQGILTGNSDLSAEWVNVPVKQRTERAITFQTNTAPRVLSYTQGFVIGTNDFTAGAKITWPDPYTFAGAVALSSSPLGDSGAYGWVVFFRNDDLIEVTKRSSGGLLASGDFSSRYYKKPLHLTGKDVWVVITRKGGTTVELYVDGEQLTPINEVNVAGFIDPVGGGVNYWHIGLISVSFPIQGRLSDAALWNFAMPAADVANLGAVPFPVKWKNGTQYVTQTSGTLEVGWEYRILTYNAGDSFTGSGAAANANEATFVYNGTAPTWTNSSVLIHNGLIAWPDFSLGYGKNFPDRTTNNIITTGVNGIIHTVDDIPGEEAANNPIKIVQSLQGGVKFNNAAGASRITVNSLPAIGTNDFTAALLSTYTARSVGSGIFSLSPTQTSESGAYSFYLFKRSDNIIEITMRSSAGGSGSGDYASQFYRALPEYYGRDVWWHVTRRGTNVILYVNCKKQVPYTDNNQANWINPIGNGVNYWQVGLASSALEGVCRDAMLFNFPMAEADVAKFNTTPLPPKWLMGTYTTQSSGTLTYLGEYSILTFVAGDNFSNVGGVNASATTFVATGTSPTTWANSSVLRRNGVTAWLDMSAGIGYQVHDITGHKYSGILFSSAVFTVPRRTGTIRWRTSTSGNQQIFGVATSIPSNARISDWTIISDGSGSATTSVDLGNVSAGAQIASAVTIGSGFNDVATFVSRYSTTGNLFVKANGSSVLDHNITYVIIE